MKTSIKLSFLALAILGLTACGSSGGAGGNGTAQDQNHPPVNPPENSLVAPPPISTEMEQLIKQKKVIEPYVEEVFEIPTFDNKVSLLGKEFGREAISLDLFPRYQVVQTDWSDTYKAGENKLIDKGFFRVYNQLYSGTVGVAIQENIVEGPNPESLKSWPINYMVGLIVGVNTTQQQLPTAGSATYKGVAFDETTKGDLTYHIDFGTKQGSGQITGFDKYGVIDLEQASISNIKNKTPGYRERFNDNQLGIEGKATSQIKVDKDILDGYELQLFGPNAEEVGGFITSKENDKISEYEDKDAKIGFGGTKQ
ncbi:hypothetical protein BMT54_03950 [Pasteurellaceae bacterium 15-036681]|nr:hypothetical protein BMT54_03950 [Pasteurellaceae bacterium 15-036681]